MTILKSAAETCAVVRVVKFVEALWLDDDLRVNLVLVFENKDVSSCAFSFFTLLFPFAIGEGSFRDLSQTLLVDSPLNRYKRGSYKRGDSPDMLAIYDGIPDVKVVNATLRVTTIPTDGASIDSPGSEVHVDFQNHAVLPGTRVGFRFTFVADVAATSFEHGLTYSKSRSGLVLTARLFDNDILGNLGYQLVNKDREIPCMKLYDAERLYGGFDVVLFVPIEYKAATTNPPAEGFGHTHYDYLGRPARAYLKYIWRARRVLEGEGISTPVRFGSRMVLHGSFHNAEFLARELNEARDALQQELTGMRAITISMQESQAVADRLTRRALLVAYISIGVALIGCLLSLF
ncbi:MAG: hypothetical protein P8123_04610 [bacterium]